MGREASISVPLVATTYKWYGNAITWSKMLSGNLGKKYAATVNRIGAVSPETLPMESINPVKILGKAIGNTTLRMVCNLEAPNAKLPVRIEVGIAFKASSVVLITKGNTKSPNVSDRSEERRVGKECRSRWQR